MQVFEITSLYEKPGDIAELLYAPSDADLTFRRSRRYALTAEGDAAAVEQFVRKTLFDTYSQDLHIGDGDALDGAAFVLEYGMKPGALDLEKEAIMATYRNLENPGFTLADLQLTTRVYVFAAKGETADPAPFIRDVCNPAVHTWSVA